MDFLARQQPANQHIVISCESDLNLDGLIEGIWRELDLLRVYTKTKGKYPDFSDGIILRKGSSVDTVCHSIHRSLSSEFKYALIWGSSAKHQPQRVGLAHFVQDEDVVQVIKKK